MAGVNMQHASTVLALPTACIGCLLLLSMVLYMPPAVRHVMNNGLGCLAPPTVGINNVVSTNHLGEDVSW
jgi:hypothetical protein